MKKEYIKTITYNGLIAALYVALTLLSIPISFGQIQFRIAEILVIFCFFNKKNCLGIILGTFLANLFSTLGLWDLLFGTFATALTCLFVCNSKHLIVSIIWPVVFNAIIIAIELYIVFGFGPIELLFINMAYVAFGELVVMIGSYILFMLFKKRKEFAFIVNGNQNLDFKF